MGSKGTGISYFYQGYSDGKLRKKTEEGKEEETAVGNCGKWEAGNTVTIFLDCDSHKITFWKDSQRMGTMHIAKDVTYYPAMCECHCTNASDYVLITKL